MKSHKRYFRGLILILISAALYVKLPYTDLSLAKLVLPPMPVGDNSTIYLSGLPVFMCLIFGFMDILKSKVLPIGDVGVGLMVFFVVIPLAFYGVDLLKGPFFITQSDLHQIDFLDGHLTTVEDREFMLFTLDLEYYGQENQVFQVQVQVSDHAATVIGVEEFQVKAPQEIHIQRGQQTYEFRFPIDYQNGSDPDGMLYHEPVDIILSNETDQVHFQMYDGSR